MPPYGRATSAELDQLFRGGEERRRVDQRRADAERAGLHLLADQAAHTLELVGRRRAVVVADDVRRAGSSRRRTTRRSARRPCRSQVRQVLGQRRPRDRRTSRSPWSRRVHPLLHRVAQRAHRLAFAEDLQGHALLDVALRPPVGEHDSVYEWQHVDEARRHGQPAGIDLRPRPRRESSPMAATRSPAIPTSASLGAPPCRRRRSRRGSGRRRTGPPPTGRRRPSGPGRRSRARHRIGSPPRGRAS